MMIIKSLLIAFFIVTIHAQIMGTYLRIHDQIIQDFLEIKPPKTVDQVDLERYFGIWYEQSLIPNLFQIGCTQTSATYTLNQDCKNFYAQDNNLQSQTVQCIIVENTCKNVINGRFNTATGKAKSVDQKNSKLIITFPQSGFLQQQYWIVRLDQQYRYSVVSSPDYNSLWILYREPTMPKQLYQDIIEDLKKDGFPVQKLVKTNQQPQNQTSKLIYSQQ